MIHVCFISARKTQEDEIGMLFATIRYDKSRNMYFKTIYLIIGGFKNENAENQ